MEKVIYKVKIEDNSDQYMTMKEIILCKMNQDYKQEILETIGRKEAPKVIIIDGVDGVGKTTIVESIIKQLESSGESVVYNKFKRRRSDKEKFKIPGKEHEWEFRKEVVEEINRRLVTYEKEDWIIVDKSPYSEYFYQRVKEFDRGLISPYGNYLMEKEIFKYKKIIDNAIVIFLENKDCWNNYYNRESKKKDTGHNTSYKILNEQEYMSMVRSFKDHQHIYENTKRYKKVEIKNDKKSWKVVYDTIMKLSENGY